MRVNFSFERLQFGQIISVDFGKRCLGIHVVSVQCRGVIDEQSLRLDNGGKAGHRLRRGCNELIVVERVYPTEGNEEWIGSFAWLTGNRGWLG